MNQLCPLCGNPAAYEIFHNPYCKHFTCPTCIEFCIDEKSEVRLKTMEAEFRVRHSNHAKGSNDSRLWVIRVPNNAELSRDRSTTMIGEFVQLSR